MDKPVPEENNKKHTSFHGTVRNASRSPPKTTDHSSSLSDLSSWYDSSDSSDSSQLTDQQNSICTESASALKSPKTTAPVSYRKRRGNNTLLLSFGAPTTPMAIQTRDSDLSHAISTQESLVLEKQARIDLDTKPTQVARLEKVSPTIQHETSPTSVTSSVVGRTPVLTATVPPRRRPPPITFPIRNPSIRKSVAFHPRGRRGPTARKSASQRQPSYLTRVSNSDSDSDKRPAKRAKKDSDSECEDSSDDRVEVPKQRGRPPRPSPLSEILALNRKSARLLKAMDVDLEKLQEKDAQIDKLKAENARLQQGWNDSKRTVEDLKGKLEECGKAEIELKSELAQAKELLKKAEHESEVKAREMVESNDAWAREKEALEERVKRLEATMVQSKDEFNKFIEGLKSGLPGLERLFGGIASETTP